MTDPASLDASHSPKKNDRKRIVFIDHTAVMGGGEIAMLYLVTHLNQTRFEPVVILFSDGPLRQRLESEGIRTILYPLDSRVTRIKKNRFGIAALFQVSMLWNTARFAWKLAQLLKKLRADLVHTNSLKADLIAGLAARWAGVPLVWHVHDRIAEDYLPRRAVQMFRALCGILPRRIVANSDATLATLKLRRPAKGRTVHCGTLASNIVSPRAITAERMTKIILVGRICRWKGQHIFLEAAAIVLRTYPDARFQIVGSSLFGEEEYEKEVRAQAEQLGLNGCVEFTGFRNDVISVIGQSDILVHASIIGEPFGMVIIEGMGAGKPVVATNGGGVPEIVLDGVTGMLVPLGNAPAMAEALIRLLSNPIAARQMGEAGRQRVLEHFRITRTARKIEAIYNEMLQLPPAEIIEQCPG